MANDRYQYLAGRKYAAEFFESARAQIADAKIIIQIIDNLEKNCDSKPVSFAEGIRSTILLARFAIAQTDNDHDSQKRNETELRA